VKVVVEEEEYKMLPENPKVRMSEELVCEDE
jgi:hypothetical protein